MNVRTILTVLLPSAFWTLKNYKHHYQKRNVKSKLHVVWLVEFLSAIQVPFMVEAEQYQDVLTTT